LPRLNEVTRLGFTTVARLIVGDVECLMPVPRVVLIGDEASFDEEPSEALRVRLPSSFSTALGFASMELLRVLREIPGCVRVQDELPAAVGMYSLPNPRRSTMERRR
jgi:hypothetical protein